jgi:hypothetical protein
LLLLSQVIGDEIDEFGGNLQQDELFFSVPGIRSLSVVKESDQEVPDLLPFDEPEGVPDVLRSGENQRTASPNLDLLLPTLSEDIMDIVEKQRPTRKRSLSETFDVSVRIERAAKVPKLGVDDIDQNNNISSFDSNANVLETVENAEFNSATAAPENIPTIAHDTSDILVVPPTTPAKSEAPIARKTRKPKQKKRKLVIDECTKITDKELNANMEQYQQTMTDESPLETFMQHMGLLNHSADSFWMKPASRLKFCAAKNILPLFERNCVVIKLKRLRQEANSPESPPKKRMLRVKTSTVQEVNEKTVIDEIIPELPPVEFIPDLPELPPIHENELRNPQFEEFPLTLPIVELPPLTPAKKSNKKIANKKKSSADYSRGYQEK